MSMLIYNEDQLISVEQYILLLKTNEYQNIKIIQHDKFKEIDETIVNPFDIFIKVVTYVSGNYVNYGDGFHNFNLNDIILRFNTEKDLSKLKIGINDKKSYLFPDDDDPFKLYEISFDILLFILETHLKNPDIKISELLNLFQSST